MKITNKNNFLTVRKRFFETSVFFLLPLLLLPFVSESHYRYIYLYLVLAMFYIWLYVKEMKHPVLLLNNNVLNFRAFDQYTYCKGFLTYEGEAYNLTTLPLKDISRIDYNYPKISVVLAGDKQFIIALKVTEDNFIYIKGKLSKALKASRYDYR